MLKQKLADDLKSALKSSETLRVSVLRMLLSAIINREIEVLKKETGLTDEETLEVLSKELKKRKDSAREFARGGRRDLAEKEEKEAEMIADYLPQEISDEELQRIVLDSVRESGAKGPGDFGKAMKTAMAVLKSRASGDRVSSAVRKALENV